MGLFAGLLTTSAIANPITLSTLDLVGTSQSISPNLLRLTPNYDTNPGLNPGDPPPAPSRILIRDLQPKNVLTGPNGCGKSNLYNSLVLIARAAEGRLARAIAEEGGTPSVFWAAGERIRLQRKSG